MRRVWRENSEGSPDGRLCPAHRHWPEQPTPQGVGAVAAIERDDRAAVSERVPRCLPGTRGNKMRREVQARGGTLHTSRTGNGDGGRAGSPVTAAHREPPHMFPHRIHPSRTCSRSAGAGGARPDDQGDVCPFTRYRPRSREHRTRYRSALVFHVVQAAVRAIVRGPGRTGTTSATSDCWPRAPRPARTTPSSPCWDRHGEASRSV